MYIAVKFNAPDPTQGLYNQLPQATVDILDGEVLPTSGFWVKMSMASLSEYLERVRSKTEQLTLAPATSGVIEITTVDISKMSPEEINVTRNKIKRTFGTALVLLITDQLGGKNVDLKKDGTYVIKMSIDLQPIASLLNSGALRTAYGVTMQLSTKYPEHKEIFDSVKRGMRDFLASIGE